METAIDSQRERQLECARRLRDAVPRLRSLQRELGSLLIELEELARVVGWAALGTTSFPMACELLGLSPGEAYQYRNAERLCGNDPDLAGHVDAGTVNLQKAAVAATMVQRGLLEADETPSGLTLENTTRELEHLQRKRLAEKRAGERLEPRTFFLTPQGVLDLNRSRDLLSRRLQRVADESETVETALSEFVDRHDPERKAERTLARRAGREEKSAREKRATRPDEAAEPGEGPGRTSRYLPAAELAALLAVAGDRCWVERCDTLADLEAAHRKPARDGGPACAANAYRFCREHHAQHDAGEWFLKRSGGRILMLSRAGTVVGRLRAAVGSV